MLTIRDYVEYILVERGIWFRRFGHGRGAILIVAGAEMRQGIVNPDYWIISASWAPYLIKIAIADPEFEPKLLQALGFSAIMGRRSNDHEDQADRP